MPSIATKPGLRVLGLAFALLGGAFARPAPAGTPTGLWLELRVADHRFSCGFCGNPSSSSVLSSTRVSTDGAFELQWLTTQGIPALSPFSSIERRTGALAPATRRTLSGALAAARVAIQGDCHREVNSYPEAHLVSRQWWLTWHGRKRTHAFLVTSDAASPWGGQPLPACPVAVVDLLDSLLAQDLVGGVP